jgi:LPXTG-site transpeptidase (sortase) family protein
VKDQEENHNPKKVLAKKKIGLSFIILLIGVLGVVVFWNSRSKFMQNMGTITYSTDTPNESKKDAENYKWTGLENEPKKIIINKIGVNAFVQSVGVDQNQKIAVPNNVHLAAWFKDSALPGDNGLAIIDGHVSGKTTDGVFKNLNALQKGDTFKIEKGDGRIVEYVVFKTASVPEAQASAILFSQDPSLSSQLNLITCGGQFNKQSQQYSDRVIISAQIKI